MFGQERYEIRSSLEIKLKQSTEVNCRPLKGEKGDVYRAVRRINVMENLKVLAVRYEKFLVANKYRYM